MYSQGFEAAPRRRRKLGRDVALGAVLAALLLPSAAFAAPKVTPLPSDTVLVIYFADANGKIEPHRFYNGTGLFQMSDCRARLEYLTKMFYRATRKDPSLKGKKAVKSACEHGRPLDLGSN